MKWVDDFDTAKKWTAKNMTWSAYYIVLYPSL